MIENAMFVLYSRDVTPDNRYHSRWIDGHLVWHVECHERYVAIHLNTNALSVPSEINRAKWEELKFTNYAEGLHCLQELYALLAKSFPHMDTKYGRSARDFHYRIWGYDLEVRHDR